jgi:8-oxo-dGTP pyrophosphatase MutT (NUDIX family)
MKLSYKYHTFNLPVALMLLLKRRMRWVRAAGGIITAPDGQRLLILRNGRWDLPKGKVEAGETLQQAALREVAEETGVEARIQNPVPIKTYHIFKWGVKARRANFPKGWHLKQTSWFYMTADKQPFTPQQEEGITCGEWVAPDEWHRRLEQSYGTLRTLSKIEN